MPDNNSPEAKANIPQKKSLLSKAIDWNSNNAIEEEDGVFSINKNLVCRDIQLDPYFKELVDTVLNKK